MTRRELQARLDTLTAERIALVEELKAERLERLVFPPLSADERARIRRETDALQLELEETLRKHVDIWVQLGSPTYALRERTDGELLSRFDATKTALDKMRQLLREDQIKLQL